MGAEVQRRGPLQSVVRVRRARKCFFIEPHCGDAFFGRGQLYGSPDDASRFAFLSKAALEFLLKAGKRPQIIHCHDWQTALVPVLLFEIYQGLGMEAQRVCFTVHNFGHQGVAGEWVLWATGLCDPGRYFCCERLRDEFNPVALNLLKGGIVYANFVTTVSPGTRWRRATPSRDAASGTRCTCTATSSSPLSRYWAR